MDDWSAIRCVHKLGSPVSGTVIALDDVEYHKNIPSGFIHLETESTVPAVLSYGMLTESPDKFDSTRVPKLGDRLNTVICNVVNGRLYLSARPQDLSITMIEEWNAFYNFIETFEIGQEISGRVVRVMPFGIFVDIGSDFPGLIDIGHSEIATKGSPPPSETVKWPVVGQQINCFVEYLRLHNRQIGLSYRVSK